MFTQENIATILTIFSLICFEIALSFDNAALIAIIARVLPESQRTKAGYYGVGGAIFFRGLFLFLIAFLTKFWWLSIFGGLYLIYVAYDGLNKDEEDDTVKEHGWLIAKFGLFWGTVIKIEIADMSLSYDNSLVLVSMSDNFKIIIFATAVGMVMMRFASGFFSKIMTKHKSLVKIAFAVIGFLGLKIVVAAVAKGLNFTEISNFLGSHEVDMFTSLAILVLFMFPLVKAKLFPTTLNN